MKKISWYGECITLVAPRDNLKEVALKCEEEGTDCVFAQNINPFGRTIEKAVIRLKPFLSKGITVFFLSCGMGFREVTNQFSVKDGKDGLPLC